MPYYQNKKTFTPKKPVRSFRDLDVYQKSMECACLIAKDMKPKLARLKYDYLENMLNCSMSVPLYIGEAHSTRFADFKSGWGTYRRYYRQIRGRPGENVPS
jgi:hypothetical protein